MHIPDLKPLLILIIVNGSVPGSINLSKSEILYIMVFTLFTLTLITGCTSVNQGWTIKPESFMTAPDSTADEMTREVTIYLNQTMLVSYPWSPEDGRYYRVSVTNGLFIVGDRYIPYTDPVPVTYSGVREWMVKAIEPGEHRFISHLRPRATSWNQEIEVRTVDVTVLP